MKTCKSCGDTLNTRVEWEPSLCNADRKALAKLRQMYCEDCAEELATGKLKPTTTMHDAGGGRRVIRDPRGLG